jgi:hypothetical protein
MRRRKQRAHLTHLDEFEQNPQLRTLNSGLGIAARPFGELAQ